MIIEYGHDGGTFCLEGLKSEGFYRNLYEGRDFTKLQPAEINEGRDCKYNFVGFLTNNNNDMLAVFPKHFRLMDLKKDANLIFRLISERIQKDALYIGDKPSVKYESNFPFASFFTIYDYYLKHGLYYENNQIVREGSEGRVDWKSITKRSQKVIVDERLIFTPIYYRAKRKYDTLLTECMAYAINYTIDKFGCLLGLPGVNFASSRQLLEDKEFMLSYLRQEREQAFSDIKANLITSLIDFYSTKRLGGDYVLKFYSFNLIWQDIAIEYLSDHFDGMNEAGEIKLAPPLDTRIPFVKSVFNVNAFNAGQRIEPDYYYLSNDAQFIFDAKYYTEMTELDYKQLVYTLLLNGRKGIPEDTTTYSALILPSESRNTRGHFKIDSAFNDSVPEIVINEEYLDMREVVEYHFIAL